VLCVKVGGPMQRIQRRSSVSGEKEERDGWGSFWWQNTVLPHFC